MLHSGPGKGGRVETAVSEVALVAGADTERVEGLVVVAADPSAGGGLHLHTELKFNLTRKKTELNIKAISGSQVFSPPCQS